MHYSPCSHPRGNTQDDKAAKDGAEDVQLRIAWQYRRYLKDQERRVGSQAVTPVPSGNASGGSSSSSTSAGRRSVLALSCAGWSVGGAACMDDLFCFTKPDDYSGIYKATMGPVHRIVRHGGMTSSVCAVPRP